MSVYLIQFKTCRECLPFYMLGLFNMAQEVLILITESIAWGYIPSNPSTLALNYLSPSSSTTKSRDYMHFFLKAMK